MVPLGSLRPPETGVSQGMEKKALQLKTRVDSGKTESREELQKVAQEFESIFIHSLLKSLRKTIPKSGFFDSFSMDMYEQVFDQEMAKHLAAARGIGLADLIYQDLVRRQEAARDGSGASTDPKAPPSGPPFPIRTEDQR